MSLQRAAPIRHAHQTTTTNSNNNNNKQQLPSISMALKSAMRPAIGQDYSNSPEAAIRQQQQTVNHHSAASSLHQESIITRGDRVQRKIFTFLYIYATLIVAIYVTYAAYYFYQHHSSSQTQRQQPGASSGQVDNQQQEAALIRHENSINNKQDSGEMSSTAFSLLEEKLESKIHLLERYIEVIAVDLQETKNKLREREKCDCQMSCLFNGTRYADRSSWQNQCDTCTCQSGKISCQPQKCPPTNCDDPVQLAGQCCPTCMKRCKYNASVLRHGQKFIKSSESGAAKECKCQDGRIKCEPQAQSETQKVKLVAAQVAEIATTTRVKLEDDDGKLKGGSKSNLVSSAAKVINGPSEIQPSVISGSSSIVKRQVESKDKSERRKNNDQMKAESMTSSAISGNHNNNMKLTQNKVVERIQMANNNDHSQKASTTRRPLSPVERRENG